MKDKDKNLELEMQMADIVRTHLAKEFQFSIGNMEALDLAKKLLSATRRSVHNAAMQQAADLVRKRSDEMIDDLSMLEIHGKEG